MKQETIELVAPSGARAQAVAEILRYSPAGRMAKAAVFVLAGLVGGTACIIIPILHLITTWALPLGGILLGLRAYRRRIVLYELKGECPHCRRRIELGGGSIDDPQWQTCPECQTRMVVAPDESPSQ